MSEDYRPEVEFDITDEPRAAFGQMRPGDLALKIKRTYDEKHAVTDVIRLSLKDLRNLNHTLIDFFDDYDHNRS
jgi:hypothetical protein